MRTDKSDEDTNRIFNYNVLKCPHCKEKIYVERVVIKEIIRLTDKI